MGEMKPESLKRVFADRLFRVPDYQRGYSWEESQLSDFWDDLINLPKGRDHYMGMLTLRKLTDAETEGWVDEKWLLREDVDAFHVVDGQQRLATASILIQCLCEHYRKGCPRKDSEISVGDGMRLDEVVKHFVYREKPEGILRAYLFGYEKDNPSFEYYRHRILGERGAGALAETFYTANLAYAKKFFSENIEAYKQAWGSSALDEVFRALRCNMKLIVHEISDDFDIFAAFETMNNRGKRLSNLELLKSRLVYLSTLLGLDVDQEAALRRDINSCWAEVYYQLGRSGTRLSDDDFLRDHWILRYQYRGRRGQDYASFLLGEEFALKNVTGARGSVLTERSGDASCSNIHEEELIDDDDQLDPSNESKVKEHKLTAAYIKEYAVSLKEAARWWYAVHCPHDESGLTSDERLWLEKINRLGFAYFRPLVTASFVADVSTPESRIELLKEVERFIFVAFKLSNAYTSFNRNNTYAMARKVASGDLGVTEAAAAIRERLEGLTNAATKFDQSGFEGRLRRLFATGDKNGYYGWSGLRYFLHEYEVDRVSCWGNPQKISDLFAADERDTVSIEHIFPKEAADSYWVHHFREYNEEERIRLRGSLGNLLPLSMRINAQLQNFSYPDKRNGKCNEKGEVLRRGYTTGSVSENMVATHYSEWNAAAILDRGMNLLSFMEKRWDIRFENDEAKRRLLFLDNITL